VKKNKIYISQISKIVKKYYPVQLNDCSGTFFGTIKQAKDFVKWANNNNVDEFSVLDAVDKWHRDNDFNDYRILERKEIFKKKRKAV